IAAVGHPTLKLPGADAVDNRAAGVQQRIPHLLVISLLRRRRRVAVVVLQIINPPLGVGIGIDNFVTSGAGVAAASLRSSVGINAKLQTLGVHVVGQRL